MEFNFMQDIEKIKSLKWIVFTYLKKVLSYTCNIKRLLTILWLCKI